ncbi:MAG TPA: crossover junction endodeoxyribonuclease RuvC [Calditrichia bacterium]|nr:crossover junction endodeoxyribonuclease RuvC [Calditrichota bacterium]HQU72940.1 crossover junction endodeoxyribonuclease RuvC [Calditrichia bacterium]HQV32389.1 crossover junction endodeoxyribonuclease RuvC [Calditrichia bacterium]
MAQSDNAHQAIILGIDPGLSITGYGLICVERGRASSLAYGGIRSPGKTATLPEKLVRIYQELSAVIAEYHPQYCAIEEVFYHENVNTAIVMGHARGVAMLAASQAGIEVAEYAAREVKMSTVGSGAASKQQVQAMVTRLLGLPEPPKPQDAADALAVALCHFHRLKFQRMVKRR